MQNKLAYLKKNPQKLNKILGTSQNRIDRLATFMQSNPVRITKGYPRTPAELPSICIMLAGEEETPEGLGNKGDDDDVDVRTYTEQLEVLIDGTDLYVDTTHKNIGNVSKIIHNEFGQALEEIYYYVSDPTNGKVTITSPNVEEGDTLTVSYVYSEFSEDDIGVLYDANYRIEVWALNGDLTVELYHIVKWMLLSGRNFLADEKDLLGQKLGGADFQPATNYMPEFVYRRAVTFWCQFTASTPVEELDESDNTYITGVVTNPIPLENYEVTKDGY